MIYLTYIPTAFCSRTKCMSIIIALCRAFRIGCCLCHLLSFAFNNVNTHTAVDKVDNRGFDCWSLPHCIGRGALPFVPRNVITVGDLMPYHCCLKFRQKCVILKLAASTVHPFNRRCCMCSCRHMSASQPRLLHMSLPISTRAKASQENVLFLSAQSPRWARSFA